MDPTFKNTHSIDRPIKILLFTLCFFSSAYFFHENPGWNVNSRLNLVYAIVDLGTFKIDSFISISEYETEDVALFDGHYYSDKIIGTSLFGIPPYWLLRQLCDFFDVQPSAQLKRYVTTTFSVSIFSALAIVMIYTILLEFNLSYSLAFSTSLLIFAGTLLFPFSTLFYPYGIATFFTLLSFQILLKAKQKGTITTLNLHLAGISMGFALLCDYIYLWVFLSLCLYSYLSFRKRIKLIHHLFYPVGIILPLLIYALYLKFCFGSFLNLPYKYEIHPIFQEGIRQGFMGLGLPRLSVLYYLTIHPYRGIFIESPFLILGLVGMILTFKSNPKWKYEIMISALIVIIYLLFNSAYYMWWGGWVMGPRHLIPMIPFLAMWFPFSWTHLKKGRLIILLFVLISLILVGVPTMVDPQTRQGYLTPILLEASISSNLQSTVFTLCFPFFFQGMIATNGGNYLLGLNGLWSLLPLFIIILTFIIWGITLCKRRDKEYLLKTPVKMENTV